jgi:hypothetical protein
LPPVVSVRLGQRQRRLTSQPSDCIDISARTTMYVYISSEQMSWSQTEKFNAFPLLVNRISKLLSSPVLSYVHRQIRVPRIFTTIVPSISTLFMTAFTIVFFSLLGERRVEDPVVVASLRRPLLQDNLQGAKKSFCTYREDFEIADTYGRRPVCLSHGESRNSAGREIILYL